MPHRLFLHAFEARVSLPCSYLAGKHNQFVILAARLSANTKLSRLFQFHHSSQCVSPFKPILLSTWSKAVNGRNLSSCEDEQNLPLCSSLGTAPTLDLSTLLVPPLTPACPSGMALSRVWVQTILVHRYSGQPSPC